MDKTLFDDLLQSLKETKTLARGKKARAVQHVDRRTVDEVAGMLAPHLKGRRIRWGALAASAREAWGRTR